MDNQTPNPPKFTRVGKITESKSREIIQDLRFLLKRPFRKTSKMENRRHQSILTQLLYFVLISNWMLPMNVDATFFYATSFADTSRWKEVYSTCEENSDPNEHSVVEKLFIEETGQTVRAVSQPFLGKISTPIKLEFPDENDFVENVTGTLKTISFRNEPKQERYFLSYYLRPRELPVLEPGDYSAQFEVADIRMLSLTADTFQDSINYLSLTGFEPRNSSQTSRELIFSEAVFLGAPGNVFPFTSHEVEGTRYPMEIYLYFSHPDCSLLECAYQLVVLVEESEEENKQVKPLVDVINHDVRGLRVQELKFIQKYNSTPYELGRLDEPQSQASWRVWYRDLQASHTAYRVSSQNRDQLETLERTINRLNTAIRQSNISEPLIYDIRKYSRSLNPTLSSADARILSDYSDTAHRVLNLVDQFLSVAFDGTLSADELEVLYEDFNREVLGLQEDLLKLYNMSTASFDVEIRNTDPLNLKRTAKMKSFREEVAKIYQGMRVLANQTVTLNGLVRSAGFLSALQAHQFGPAKAKEVAIQINDYKENEYLGLNDEQEEARKNVPKVYLEDQFHISWLLPPTGGHFIYTGSIPFPPCHTVSRTVVFDHPIKMSRSQIEALTTIPLDGEGNLIKNTRPPFATQNPNERDAVNLQWDTKNHQWTDNDGVQRSSVERAAEKSIATDVKTNYVIIIIGLGVLSLLDLNKEY